MNNPIQSFSTNHHTASARFSLPEHAISTLLTHFIYEFYPSHSLEKRLKYNKNTLLGFILTISTSFGKSMNLQGLFRKYAKKLL
jgi:hypothetical protein